MSLAQKATPPAVPAPTPQQITQAAIQRMNAALPNAIQSGFAILAAVDRANRAQLATIWSDPNNTPAQMFAALGTYAAGLVAGSAAATQFCITGYAAAGGVPSKVPGGTPTAYVPPTLPTGVSLTLNSDGTVTVVG